MSVKTSTYQRGHIRFNLNINVPISRKKTASYKIFKKKLIIYIFANHITTEIDFGSS